MLTLIFRGDYQQKISSCEKEKQKSEEERRKLEQKVTYTDKTSKMIDIASSVMRLLNGYVDLLKKEKRAVLEQQYNKHLKVLLDSNSIIDRVIVDESFAIKYLDPNGQIIGMSSISAGMKQLSATALLWALKDISTKDVPVIVDTPLARIDLKHQINLLEKYYPRAAKQVIILPTDSELDDRKIKYVQPYVYKQYNLTNPSGIETKVTIEQGV